jgi:endo-1,4-beta-xylanase
MNRRRLILTNVCLAVLSVCFAACKSNGDVPLKEALKDKFLIGVAMNANQITGKDSVGIQLIGKHFNSVVAENCMKSEVLQPVEGEFDFSLADQFVKFGEQHKMFIVGHTLIWHSQAPKWFFTDEKGQPVTREIMIDRMKKHITTVMTRYKGRVGGWDVVNEAINDDGSWRESPFYKIIGKDYVKLAFQFAHEADPDAQLYYNDYNMAKEGKRNAVVKLVNELKSEGIRVDAIGMQGHLMTFYPDVNDFEKSIDAFASTRAKVMITEMDMSVLPMPEKKITADVAYKFQYDPKINPYYKGLPDSVSEAFNNRLESFFRVFIKHSAQISRVTMWGLSDGDSWKNDWPVKGRTDYPLLFDRNHQPKPIVAKIVEMTTNP